MGNLLCINMFFYKVLLDAREVNRNEEGEKFILVPRVASAVTWPVAHARGAGSPTDRPIMQLAL